MIAACACGALSAQVEGAPASVGLCHCDACRRRTGSAFSLNTRFAKGAVALSGPSASYARTGDDGGVITYHFCPDCGVTVWYENSGVDGIMIPAGAFAPDALPTPATSVYHDRCPNWLGVSVAKKIA